MNKSIVLALIAGAATLGTGAAQARDVSWSIDISTPVIGTVISNAPAYPAYRAYPAYPAYSTYYPAYSSHPVAYPVAYPGYVRAVPVVVPRHGRHAWRHAHDRWNDDRGWRRD